MHTIVVDCEFIERLREETDARVDLAYYLPGLPCAFRYSADLGRNHHSVLMSSMKEAAREGTVSNEEFLKHVKEKSKPESVIYRMVVEVEVPESHPWVAMDKAGAMWAYKKKPDKDEDGFFTAAPGKQLEVYDWERTHEAKHLDFAEWRVLKEEMGGCIR